MATYLLTWSRNGGTGGKTGPLSITYGSILSFPHSENSPIKTGYTFYGWNDGLTTYSPSEYFTYTFTTGKTYTARWTAITYIAYYAANNGTSTPPQDYVNYDVIYILPAAISRTGYTFNGWKTGTETPRAAGSYFTWKYTANTTFTAQWTVNSYALTYNTNSFGGTGKTFNSVIFETTPTIPIPKAVGYTFNGWYDAQSGGTKKINSDGTGGYTMPAVATTLYAQWTDKSDVRFSYLRDTYPDISVINNRILMSAYQSSISKAASSRTALKSDFKGKGPNL